MNELVAYRAIGNDPEFAKAAAAQLATEIFAGLPNVLMIEIDYEDQFPTIRFRGSEIDDETLIDESDFHESSAVFERIAADLWAGKGRLKLIEYIIPRTGEPHFLRANGDVWDGTFTR